MDEKTYEKTYETTGPRCPYCQHPHAPDDPVFYDEMMTELECEACARTFEMRVHVSTSWTCAALANPDPQP